MTRNSRLKKRLERKTQKNLFLGVIGIGVVLYLLIRFGVPALANFAIFLSGINNNDKSEAKKELTFIPPPTIESQFTATNSSSLIISGRALKKYTIHIFVNEEEQEDVNSQTDGTFSSIIKLSEGNNTVKAKSENAGKQSGFSNTILITYIKSAPTLTISTPADGDSFSGDNKKINITGKTDSGATVTINNFWAIIDENNNYSYELPLTNGDNQITIVATDKAGNKTEKSVKVKYSQ
jgi:bacillopeptidase F